MTFKYITLPNSIISASVSRSETAVLVCMYMTAQRFGRKTLIGHDVKIKRSTLAAFCGITERHVARCIDRLIEGGFILGKIRTIREDRTLSTYTYSLPSFSRYFRVSYKALRIVMASVPELLKEYLYCCKCANGRRAFYHSYSDVASELGIKRSDAIARLSKLAELGLVRKCNKKTRRNTFTENTYITYVFVDGVIKKKVLPRHAGTFRMTTHSIKYSTENIITQVFDAVKRFLQKNVFSRGRRWIKLFFDS